MTSPDRDRSTDHLDNTGNSFARREPSSPQVRLTDASELVLVASAPRTPRFDRDDLVLRKGEYALRNGHMTPKESMLEDLLAVGAALDAAGIRYLLVRGNDERLVIAVDRADRKAVARAFADAFANEPFYAATLEPARETERFQAEPEEKEIDADAVFAKLKSHTGNKQDDEEDDRY